MKSFTIKYTKSVSASVTLTAKSETDARKRFEDIRPENARVLDVIEVDRRTADLDA